MQKQKMDLIQESRENILVCLSSSPSNSRIIQTAAKMAQAYQGSLTALYVETPASSNMTTVNQNRLEANRNLAMKNGAILACTKGDNIPFQIAEYARTHNITKIVVGRSNSSGQARWGRKTLTDKLISYAPDIEIFIIPDSLSDGSPYHLKAKEHSGIWAIPDFLKMLLSLFVATILGLLCYRFGFSDANIITIYILGVLVTSVITEHMMYGVLASILSVITFNYFFTDPRYTLLAYDIGYPMTFLVMFLASLLAGTLAARLKSLAIYSSEQAYRTKILLDTNQALQQASGQEEILEIFLEQLTKLIGHPAAIHRPDPGDAEHFLQEGDRSQELRYPILVGKDILGVVSIDVRDNPIDVFENSIVLSIISECALSLENEKNAREKEQAAVMAQNEQLRANLLRTISHDLRTPLTSISGNASILRTNSGEFSEETRQQLYTDIYDESMWLVNMVENLLSVTRMEGQGVQLHRTVELLDEVITEALNHLDRRSTEHQIVVKNDSEFLMVRMDTKLIMQVMINLVNNAIKYTPPGSKIQIHVWKEAQEAKISIEDDGPGIPDEKKKRVFELFYSGETGIADGTRSMGLGLALCKSIIAAHHGKIELQDSELGGTYFLITLPIEEVEIHE